MVVSYHNLTDYFLCFHLDHFLYLHWLWLHHFNCFNYWLRRFFLLGRLLNYRLFGFYCLRGIISSAIDSRSYLGFNCWFRLNFGLSFAHDGDIFG